MLQISIVFYRPFMKNPALIRILTLHEHGKHPIELPLILLGLSPQPPLPIEVENENRIPQQLP